MSHLIRRAGTPDETGLVHDLTPQNAGWDHVGFQLYRLGDGQTLEQATGNREVCLVLISGTADVTTAHGTYTGIGERVHLFDRTKPHSIYVPAGDSYKVTATGPLELAVCSAPGYAGSRPSRHIAPDDVACLERGEGTNARHIHNILPDSEPADSLIVVEVFTPAGHWSSYPPHKHDTDNPPEETRLEETYYHRISPAQGFAFQRIYTDDLSLDETMAVHDGDLVQVPRGYHPVGAPHGFELYYLNVMAGPRREWCFTIAPSHRFLSM